jgi:beta-ureidopropionase / N-carbamoyl-L-amino-acid hydrolase
MMIRPERLIANLRELATIGKFQTGVDRPAYSPDDMRAREWLRQKFSEAGLAAEIDSAGNVYGRMTKVARAVLVGSHSDSVPKGGWLDGSLGVIYGLELARCFAEHGPVNGVGLDVVSFQDEEGTFLALYGSRTFCGEDVSKEAAIATNKDGKTLQAAIHEAGIEGKAPARLDAQRHLAYFEAHIEQGPRLEAIGTRIGVVTAIVGIRTFRIVFRGQADHAGTTPMGMRHDAGAAALSFGAAIAERFRQSGSPDSVWNVGSIAFKPGAPNVVPDEAQLVLQLRDSSLDILQTLEDIAHETAAQCASDHQVEHEVARTFEKKPAHMDATLAGFIEQACAVRGTNTLAMPSGAGHDAMTLAKYIPSAMLFVPSIGGRSHHVSEDTAAADIILGAEVMLDAIELYLRGHTAKP